MSQPSSKPLDPMSSDMKARLATSYDAIAPTYNQFTKQHDSIRVTWTQKLLNQLPTSEDNTHMHSGFRALELGCGACGPGTQLLLENGWHVTGNDLSSTQLSLARETLSEYSDRLELIHGDMLGLKFPPSTFHAVLGFYSIIHLPREEQMVLLQRIASWLKPGGLFLANFADEEIESTTIDKWLGEDKGWMFWSGWGGEKSVEIVKQMGLEVLDRELVEDVVDANFVWVLARKKDDDGHANADSGGV